MCAQIILPFSQIFLLFYLWKLIQWKSKRHVHLTGPKPPKPCPKLWHGPIFFSKTLKIVSASFLNQEEQLHTEKLWTDITETANVKMTKTHKVKRATFYFNTQQIPFVF